MPLFVGIGVEWKIAIIGVKTPYGKKIEQGVEIQPLSEIWHYYAMPCLKYTLIIKTLMALCQHSPRLSALIQLSLLD